jgi:hypothetical protein
MYESFLEQMLQSEATCRARFDASAFPNYVPEGLETSRSGEAMVIHISLRVP